MKTNSFVSTMMLIAGAVFANSASAQYVAVTMKFDSPTISVGGSTTLHVYAQVIPAARANSDRIFSWYIDVLNDSGAVAQADYSLMKKAASDKNAQTSSFGTADGANRRGIYDTFINDTPVSKSGTGVNTPVELLSVPVQGVAPGQSTFRVAAGSGVSGLSSDFIVAPIGGGDPMTGGFYDAASEVLQVGGAVVSAPTLTAAYTRLPGGNNRVVLTFNPSPGHTNVVEYRNNLGIGPWQALPGAPHNSGTVTDTNNFATRFYRVRVSP